MHQPGLVPTQKTDKEGNVILKEKVVVDYNGGMGFVDKNNAIICQHDMVRKCQKWTTKVAFHFIEEALFNAHVLYGMLLQPSLTYTNFKLAYVEASLSPFPDLEVHTQRYHGHHYPEKIPITDPNKTSKMKRCVHCYNATRTEWIDDQGTNVTIAWDMLDSVYLNVSRNTTNFGFCSIYIVSIKS